MLCNLWNLTYRAKGVVIKMINVNYSQTVEKYSRIRKEAWDRVKDCPKRLEEAVQNSKGKIVVLDDDPTGVQAVHGIYVFTGFDKEAIREGFLGKEKVFFLLTNSRALTEDQTVKLHREIAENLMQVSKETGVPFLLLSRGDSTLRGHYPLETEVLKETLEKNGSCPYDGEVMVPFFAAGGRFTAWNVHYVKYGDELIPAGKTEFAKDQTFGYQSSDLRMYVEEKTKGRYLSWEVTCISLDELRTGDVEGIVKKLKAVGGFGKVIVNALDVLDLQVFCLALYRAMEEGCHFLFRCAADFVKILGGISDRPLLSGEEMAGTKGNCGGMVVVGSHTEKTTKQLEALKTLEGLEFMELNSDLVLEERLEEEVKRLVEKAEGLISMGKTPVIYTKRKVLEIPGDTGEQALMRSVKISEAVLRLVGDLKVKPGFVVAKGGITSSDIGVKALSVRKARVLGQAQPGVPVWETDENSKFPGIPYIIFPGNVGNDDTLKAVVEELL